MAFYLNEVHFAPHFGSVSQDQYVEIRSDRTAGSLPNDAYLVVIEGAKAQNSGKIHTIFNLNNQEFGINGFLVLAQSSNRYEFDPSARVLVGTDGFKGMPGNLFSTEVSLSNHIDFIVGSNSYLLIQSPTPPQIGNDIDPNDDGIPEGIYNNWTILDGFAVNYWVESGQPLFGYAPILFREDRVGNSLIPATIVDCERPDYVGRSGDSVGYDPKDWVVGTATEENPNGIADFRLEHGVLGTPRPYIFSGRALDHIGNSNFTGHIGGLVFQDANGDGVQQSTEPSIPDVEIRLDASNDGMTTPREFRLEPDAYAPLAELTNSGIGATLTVGRSDNTQIGFRVRAADRFPKIAENTQVFSSEGVNFFNDSNRLRIDFYTPASSVTVHFVGNSDLSPVYGKLEAYNAAGQRIGFIRTTGLFYNQSTDVTLDLGVGVIAYAMAFSDDTYLASSPFGQIDNLRYTLPDLTATTNTSGRFSFSLLPPGDYAAYATAPSGLVQQYPGGGGYHEHAVVNARGKVDANFSFLSNQDPIFPDQSFQLFENSDNGVVVGTLNVVDSDVGQALNLRILDGNIGAAFRLSGKQIILHDTTKVNFEERTQFVLRVEASDDYTPPGVTVANVTIQIRDTNDVPIIPDSEVTIDENAALGTLVASIRATDEDGGLNPTFVYRIESGNNAGLFVINQSTGDITVQGPINFEAVASFRLVVTATDNGTPQKSGRGNVSITVNNLNEAPVISTTQLSIEENVAAGTLLDPIEVNDPETEQTVQLTIMGGSAGGLVEVVGTSKQLRIKNGVSFDYEQTNNWTIDIRATDSGSPTRFTNKLITLNILDRNDPPSFSDAHFGADENIAPTTLIGTLSATDQDAGQQVQFAILAGPDASRFRLDTATGQLYPALGATLDFEAQNQYVIQVRASDNFTPPGTKTAFVTIQLNDLNDPPQISDHEFRVNENTTAGTVVGRVEASDPDAGDSLTFSMATHPQFSIHSANGDISIKPGALLDFEQSSTYSLTVQVVDQNSVSRQATVTVKINDVNEAPKLVGNIDHQSLSPGQNWSLVIPNDLFSDTDALDQLVYSATSGDGFSLPSWLSFNSLTKTFSATPGSNEIGTQSVLLRATDRGGLSATEAFDVLVVNGWHHFAKPLDTDFSSDIVPLDALLVINYINLSLPVDAPRRNLPATHALDVDNDLLITPLDVLLIINHINLNGSGEGENDSSQDGSRIDAVTSELNRLVDTMAWEQELQRKKKMPI